MNEQNEFPSPIGAFFIEWEDGVSYQEEDESFRPLLGLFFIELWKNYCSQLTKWLISVPYWGFFLLNQEYFFTMKVQNIVSVPYWGFFYWIGLRVDGGIRYNVVSVVHWVKWMFLRISSWRGNTLQCRFRPLLGLFLLNDEQLTEANAMYTFPSPIGAFFIESVTANYRVDRP